MNYTKWIEANLPTLQDESSAKTYALIQKAKKSTFVWTFSIRVILVLVALMGVDIVGPSLGVVAFRGISGWIAVMIALGLMEIILNRIEPMIVTKRIRKLANAT